jgi:hypothetical protein
VLVPNAIMIFTDKNANSAISNRWCAKSKFIGRCAMHQMRAQYLTEDKAVILTHQRNVHM